MNAYPKKWGGYDFGQPDPIVPELLRRVMLRRLRVDVLPDLPTKTYHTIKVDLPGKLAKKMDALWDEWGDLIQNDKELPPFEEFSSIRAALAESRIPALLELVEDHEEQEVPLVVFSAHIAPCEALSQRPGWEMITGSTPSKKRQEIVQRFQAGELKGLALTIRAGGVGLTLTRAWKAIFVDLDWVPSWNNQAEDRICRIGQLANCIEIVRMVSDHVLDLHVLKLIAWKITIIQGAIEKLIQTKPKQADVESDAEFEARMAAAAAAMDGLGDDESESDEWPAIVTYDDVPF
jgi:SNF2 family DNA or RNA helicase